MMQMMQQHFETSQSRGDANDATNKMMQMKTNHSIQACICKERGISFIRLFIHSGNHAFSIHSLDVAWMLH
mgnify:CR=1 FL=1